MRSKERGVLCGKCGFGYNADPDGPMACPKCEPHILTSAANTVAPYEPPRQIDDGGPAFPCDWIDFQPTTGEQVVREQHQGMSLRDWFAGQALVGILADPRAPGLSATVSQNAYLYADAMLAARGSAEPVTEPPKERVCRWTLSIGAAQYQGCRAHRWTLRYPFCPQCGGKVEVAT